MIQDAILANKNPPGTYGEGGDGLGLTVGIKR